LWPGRDWATIKQQEVAYRVKRRRRNRYSFTWEELQTLFRVAEENARDHALIRYFIHTARRRASACELRVEDVWDAARGAPKANGVVLEKFNERVTFPIDEVFGAALARWIRDSGATPFVFPSLTDPTHKWSYQQVTRWLRRLCAKAGIHGNHIYVHGLRHTVATLLHKGGDKTEDIAAVLGHKDVQTTQIYIDRTVIRPQDHMLIPWLTNPGDMAGLRLSSASIAAVASQVDAVRSADGSSSSSSSSSSSNSTTTNSGLSTIMADGTKQQQALVTALTRQLAERDEQLRILTDTYNFVVGNVLTDVQRLTLGNWQKTQAAAVDRTWTTTVAQTYAEVADEISDDSDSEDSGEE
jgi:hypothetical protein